MTMHPTPAERLLAMLEEQGAVEALPAGEVREELAALGVDPARSIAFAKAMARGGDSPGGQLMGALMAGDEEDGEIARIESADIEAVREQVHQGTAAAIAAEARRKAGIDDNVVGSDAKRRKRRRRLAVWGGPLAGIAASLLVVFFMGSAYLSSSRRDIASSISGSRVPPPAPEMPDPAMEGYTKPGPDSSLADELLAQGRPPPPESAGRAKEKTFADSSPAAPAEEMLALNEPAPLEKKSVAPPEALAESRVQDQVAAAPPPAAFAPPREQTDGSGAAGLLDTLAGAVADGEADIAADNEPGALARRSNDAPTLPGIVAPPSGNFADGGVTAETETAAAADGDTAIAGANRVDISEIAAVLVLDSSQAPLQVQSPILPAGGLADRVEEASRLAGDRPVIALYTIATGTARRDFAQVSLRPGFTQQFAAPSPMVGLLGVEATEYDFIALPIE